MIIIDGKPESAPGLITHSWLENPALRLAPEDFGGRPRLRIRSIVLHTTQGLWPQSVNAGAGKGGGAAANVHAWRNDHRCAGSHLLVDTTGEIVCAADLSLEQTYHAMAINPVSIGIEIVQRSDGSLFQAQVDSIVVLCDWLTRRFKIQRQIPDAYRGAIPRLEQGGRDFVGICGHRDQSSGRGRGDPGDVVFEALAAAGYERFNLLAGDDRATWRDRQKTLGLGVQVDGIPLDKTCAALEAAGYEGGLWVSGGAREVA